MIVLPETHATKSFMTIPFHTPQFPDHHIPKYIPQKMPLLANDMESSAVSLVDDDELNNADNEDTAYTVSDTSAVSLSNPDELCEANAETGAQVSCKMGTETDDEIVANVVCKTKPEADDDESVTYLATNTLTEHMLKKQTEETRLDLVEIAEDEDLDGIVRSFAMTAADIIEWWQVDAEDDNPTSYQVDFGVGSPINLLMVLALLPEKYQGAIRIEDENRSPSADGENLSWLHEQTMDVLVELSINPTPAPIVFRQGLASMVRDDVDEGWRGFTGRSWLEDQIHLLSNDELDPDLYRFPPDTEKIVFLFNPTEIHWTVVEVELDDEGWTYNLYNSLCQGERGPTWKACQEQFPLLEKLICHASGFPEPESRKIIAAISAQQGNMYDCGPIAMYNAMELLEGRVPRYNVDTERLRRVYLLLILEAVYLLDEGLETPAFKARMRKVCLDYMMSVPTDLDTEF